MRTLLTILALACLACVAATPPLPPFPGTTTNRVKVLPTNSVRFTPPPRSYGVGYTNKLSLLDSNRWLSGFVRVNPRYVAHTMLHDTATRERTLIWPSVPHHPYAIEAAWGEVPLPRYGITNWYPTTVFYVIATNGGWSGTNVSRYVFAWNTSNVYVRVVEL